MLTLDYNTVIKHQYDDVNKSRKKIAFYFHNLFTNWLHYFVKRGLKKVNNILLSQLLSSKGLLSDIKEKAPQLQGQNLTKVIDWVDSLIKVNVSFKTEIEKIILEDDGNDFPEMLTANSALEETIETLYNILRILKKCNGKTTVETSEEAINSAKHSLHSLQTVLHGRRTT